MIANCDHKQEANNNDLFDITICDIKFEAKYKAKILKSQFATSRSLRSWLVLLRVRGCGGGAIPPPELPSS